MADEKQRLFLPGRNDKLAAEANRDGRHLRAGFIPA